jgi:hypothetical protein
MEIQSSFGEAASRPAIETRLLPALTHGLPPIRPLGFPIYVARRPAAPFARSYPRHFTLLCR